MSTFTVHVTTTEQSFSYEAVGTDSAAVSMSAIDLFGVCGVSVKPALAR